MNKIDYNSQQFKWAKEIMQEKNVTILDIDWNKFDTKEEIKEFIDMLISTTDKIWEEIKDEKDHKKRKTI